MIVKGNIVDIFNKEIYQGSIHVVDGKIKEIKRETVSENGFLIPGFTDAHVHIESSMLVPSEFARIAVLHGTVATVSDPHEIANVLGVEGVNYMIENGNQVPLKFHFGAPSCVPATSFETAGAVINAAQIDQLMQREEILYLAEMMNYPGVLFKDEEVMKKIASAKKYGKPIDGHAPGLMGEDAATYAAAGISTDHECFTYEEALGKLKLGMKILIREGSAAKNFNALIDLLPEHYTQMMFCSDDKHPDDLLLGHLDQLVARAVANGIEVFKVLQAACINPVLHYNLPVGLLREGDAADFIRVENLTTFNVLETYINGVLVAQNKKCNFDPVPIHPINNFNTSPKSSDQFRIKGDRPQIRVIEALDGELITNEKIMDAQITNGFLESNVAEDMLKIVMVNRYKEATPSIAFIHGFGLKKGAIASCVGHDSHNIIAVGTSDEALTQAVNLIIKHQGGISAVNGDIEEVLPLPIAGIMSDQSAEEVGKAYQKIDQLAKEMGSKLHAPFMTLSFMGLLVIPSLKLSDLGLFDGGKFAFTTVSCA